MAVDAVDVSGFSDGLAQHYVPGPAFGFIHAVCSGQGLPVKMLRDLPVFFGHGTKVVLDGHPGGGLDHV